LAFCDPPNTDFVTDQSRVNIYDGEGIPHNLSQCVKYGGGGHGWFGETYTGTIVTAGIKHEGQVYTIMNKQVGLVGNQCGPILEGSVGIEPNTTVRGIMGTGSNDKYTYSDFINASTWTDLAIKTGMCIWNECVCPPPIASGFASTFMSKLAQHNIYQFGITWEGILGKNTGKMLWNEEAEKAIPDFNPKVAIEKDPTRTFGGLWGTNVTGIAMNWTMTNVSQTMYYLDTGAGYISLPAEIYDNVTDGTVVSFFFDTLDWEYGNSTQVNVTVTQELIDARVFRRASQGGIHLMGLNIFRYLDNLLISFNDTDPYFRATARADHILDLPAKLPVGELATSVSEDIQELNVTNATTGEVKQNSTNVVSTTIMDTAGIGSSAPTNILKAGIIALASATLGLIWC